MKVKVRDGWIVHDGNAVRGGGEVVDIDPDTAARWVAAGWVEQITKPTTKRTTSSRKRGT